MLLPLCLLLASASAAFAETDAAPSVVRAQQEALLSSQVSGQIVALTLEEGDSFRAGQVLVEIDCSILGMEAAAASAESVGKTAIATSQETLFSRGGSGQLDVDAARAEAAAATARADAARKRLEYCRIEAPFDGRLVEKAVNTYELVEPGKALLSIVSTGQPTLEIIAPEEWLAWVSVGAPGVLRLEATRKAFDVEISAIAPVVDPVSRTLKLWARFRSDAQEVLPGMSGLVTVGPPE